MNRQDAKSAKTGSEILIIPDLILARLGALGVLAVLSYLGIASLMPPSMVSTAPVV
jgi:hypothetical protein